MLDEDQTPILPEEELRGPDSLMEQIRAKRTEVANTRSTFIPIPGFESVGLQAKYRLMERSEVEAIGRKVMDETKNRGDRQMMILSDVIINSCEGFYIQRSADKDPVQLIEEDGSFVQTYDMMAVYMGGDVADAREALMYVFSNNEFAVGSHGILLQRWMQNTGFKVDSDLLGEGV